MGHVRLEPRLACPHLLHGPPARLPGAQDTRAAIALGWVSSCRAGAPRARSDQTRDRAPAQGEGAATREGVWVSPMPGVQAATELADPWLGEGWMDRGVFRGPTRRWRPHDCGGRVVFEESSHSSLPSMPGPRSTLHGDTFVVSEASAEGSSARCSTLAFEDAVLLSPSP